MEGSVGVAMGSPPSMGGDAVNQNGSGKSERERASGAAAAATAALLGGLGFPLLPPTSMGGALGGGLPTPPRRHQVRQRMIWVVLEHWCSILIHVM